MGLTEGGVRGQILGAQIGFMSNVLEHSAWTLPFTHAHRHAEKAKLAAEKRRMLASSVKYNLCLVNTIPPRIGHISYLDRLLVFTAF